MQVMFLIDKFLMYENLYKKKSWLALIIVEIFRKWC